MFNTGKGGTEATRIDQLRTFQEVNYFFNRFRDVCDDFMFILMLKQIYYIHSLSKLSEDYVADEKNQKEAR